MKYIGWILAAGLFIILMLSQMTILKLKQSNATYQKACDTYVGVVADYEKVIANYQKIIGYKKQKLAK